MFPQANALTASIVAKVTKTALSKALVQLSKQVTKSEAKNLPDVLKIVKTELKDLEIKDFRKYVHSPSAMRSGLYLLTGAGARSVRSFVQGKNNARYSGPVIMATMAYLGWEAACGIIIDGEEIVEENETPTTLEDLGCTNGKKTGLNAQVRLQVVKKALQVFGDTLTDADWTEEPPASGGTIKGGGHGAMFHLVQTAYYQLQHRFAGGKPIKFMEKQRWVTIQKDGIEDGAAIRDVCGKADTDNKNCFIPRSRNVDIILGKGDITFESGAFKQSGREEPETWVELKSWAAQGETGAARNRFALEQSPRIGKLESWTVNGTRAGKNWTTHVQFSLDRTASHVGYAWLPKSESGSDKVSLQQEVEDFEWRFQAFRVNRRNNNALLAISPLLGNISDKNTFRGLVNHRPDVKENSTFIESEVQSSSFGSDSQRYGNKAQLADVRAMIADMVRAGFEEIRDLNDLDVEID